MRRTGTYLLDSLIETTLSRDILLKTRVDKPALLRQLFRLGCEYSGQILSYQKMLGQLQEAGDTTTLAHYLDLLTGAGMLCGIQKYAGQLDNFIKSKAPAYLTTIGIRLDGKNKRKHINRLEIPSLPSMIEWGPKPDSSKRPMSL